MLNSHKFNSIINATILVWLIILSFFIAITFSKQPDNSPTDAQFQTIELNIANLTERLQAIKVPTDTVKQGDLSVVHHELAGQITALEKSIQPQKIKDHLSVIERDLAQLDNRLTELEKQLQLLALQKQTPPPKTVVTAPPKPKEPSFKVINVELRGEQQVLSVVPNKTPLINQVQLIKIGDVMDGWTLEKIERNKATFRLNKNKTHTFTFY